MSLTCVRARDAQRGPNQSIGWNPERSEIASRKYVPPSGKSREHSTSLPRQVLLSELGWPNLLLRDKLPTGNEQGSAGMATVGSGAYTYEPVENWAKLPPGWSFKEIGGVGVDRHDNVFVFNRGEHPMIVFDCNGNFL